MFVKKEPPDAEPRFQKYEKPRLFVDMDGTLAEWRNIHIDVEDFESSTDVQKKVNEILTKPGYYRTLAPHKNVVDTIRDIIKENKIEVYVLSCVILSDKPDSPVVQKETWLAEYLPEIDKEHQIFVPNGDNKFRYAWHYLKSLGERTLGPGDYLLDDYTKNLNEWYNKRAGTYGIKLLNNLNSSKGTWKGAQVAYDSPDMKQTIEEIMLGKKLVRENNPEKFDSPVVDDKTEFVGFEKEER